MVLASGLQVCDPEKTASDLPEAAGVLGMAGKDIEGTMESMTAGEHEASHHA